MIRKEGTIAEYINELKENIEKDREHANSMITEEEDNLSEAIHSVSHLLSTLYTYLAAWRELILLATPQEREKIAADYLREMDKVKQDIAHFHHMLELLFLSDEERVESLEKEMKELSRDS